MYTINIGVCDDNYAMSKNISEIVSEAFTTYGITHSVESFTDGQILLAQHNIKAFDVLFLDIDMPKVNGFSIAQALRKEFSHCIIVFVTSHAELVYESLDFQPFNFVRKTSGVPLGVSIPQIVNKMICHLKQEEKLVITDCKQNKYSAYIRDIVYIESSAHYVYYHIFDGEKLVKIKARSTIQKCQDCLEPYSFARIHKSYLVNLRHVTKFAANAKEIVLMDEISLMLGKVYRQDADDRYTKYLRTRI